MEWYNYIAAFFAGAFLANFVPHFVKGICGDKFPSPFAKPPGKGLSSPLTNVLWGLFNIVVGYVLLGYGHICRQYPLSVVVFFVGVAALSIMCANNFQHKDKE
jgi:hypothetical protein